MESFLEIKFHVWNRQLRRRRSDLRLSFDVFVLTFALTYLNILKSQRDRKNHLGIHKG